MYNNRNMNGNMNVRWRHVLKLLVIMVGVVFIGTGCAVEAPSVETTTISAEVTTESMIETVAETEAETATATEAAGISKLSDGEISGIVAELDELSASILNQTEAADIQSLLEQFAAESQRDIVYLYYGEADDDFWMSPVTVLPEDYAFSQRPVYKNAVAQGVYLPEAYSDALSGRAIYTVAKAILVDGEVVGVIGIDVLGE